MDAVPLRASCHPWREHFQLPARKVDRYLPEWLVPPLHWHRRSHHRDLQHHRLTRRHNTPNPDL